MKTVLALLLTVVICAIVSAKPADDEKYTTKYDDFDVDSVLNNRRLLVNYMNCVLDKGKCTKEGAELKKHIGDALATDCSKCSTKQRDTGAKVLKHIYEHEKDYFKQLEEKYDPEGVYRKRYAEQAKKEGIEV